MRTLLALSASLAFVAAACTGATTTSPSPPAVSPTQAASPPPPSPTETAEPIGTAEPLETAEPTDTEEPTEGAVTIMVADADLGQILVDGEGRTLYLFTPDEAGEPTCYDSCAQNWPAVLAEGEIRVGDGLDDSDFSTVARTDGGEQVRAGTWPLYYFAADANPGDTNGQGVNDVWFVVSPEGEAIR